MRIELATRADVTAIVAIANWAAEHTAANFATESEPEAAWLASWEATATHHPWLVARADDGAGAVIGFAKASPHRPRGAYAWTAEVSVYLDADHRGQRVGTALYRRLLPLLRAQGYVTLLAGITTPNPASERLHEAFGFTRCATFPRAGWKFGQWHDVGYWSLALAPPAAAPTPILPVTQIWAAA